MKLTAQQMAQVFDQTGADPVPEDHSVMDDLREAFGDHTFYMAPEGLCVWEPVSNADSGSQVATAMIVASWTDEEKTELLPHAPQPTTIVVTLDVSNEFV